MAEMNEVFYSTSSKESEIDILLDELIAKIMSGAASHNELVYYEQLVASRTRRIRGTVPVRGASSTFRRKYA